MQILACFWLLEIKNQEWSFYIKRIKKYNQLRSRLANKRINASEKYGNKSGFRCYKSQQNINVRLKKLIYLKTKGALKA